MNRFVLLDALRGLAAVFVLFRHTVPFWGFNIYRSYLAVDLFFILSGFVIAFAYDEKLRTKVMNLRQFLLVRLIRMYPVYLFSLVLCVVVWSGNLSMIALPLAAAVFFLPWPMPGNPGLFGINGPYWSLFFELAANFLYGLLRPVLNNVMLAAILIVSAAGIAVSAFLHGNLDTGWMWGWPSISAGFARAIFGVFLGLFLYRHYATLSRFVGRFVSPWAAFVLVGVILVSPSAQAWGQLANPLIDTLLVLLVFPVLVVAASRHTGTRGRSLLLWLGAASYPLYVVHQQSGSIVQYLTGYWAQQAAPWSGIALTVGLLIFCVLLEKVYDLPLRRWLRRKLLKQL